MGNKEIQEERIRGYFIQATKEILKAEGLKSLSTRNIAQKAGYSYATIYNYFRDVKDLIFECVKDFQQEAGEFIQSKIAGAEPGKARIKSISKAYIEYFTEYPGIFELFFIEKVYNLAGKQPTVDLINTFLQRLCEEDWKFLINQKLITSDKAEETSTRLLTQTTGILLLYLHRLFPSDYQEFMKLADKELDTILEISVEKKLRKTKE